MVEIVSKWMINISELGFGGWAENQRSLMISSLRWRVLVWTAKQIGSTFRLEGLYQENKQTNNNGNWDPRNAPSERQSVDETV